MNPTTPHRIPSNDIEDVLVDCPECGPQRAGKVIAEVARNSTEFDGTLWSKSRHQMVECLGCKALVHRILTQSSEDEDYEFDGTTGTYTTTDHPWTATQWQFVKFISSPQWLPTVYVKDRILGTILDEVLFSINARLNTLATIGMRTAFDRCCRFANLDESKSFAVKVVMLGSAGFITNRDKSYLDLLVEAGNASAHRGWEPTSKQTIELFRILEDLILRVVVDPQGQLSREIKRRIPKRTSNRSKR